MSIYFTLIVESTENAIWLLLKRAYSIGGRLVHRLREDWLECMWLWVRRQVVMTCSIWMKEVKLRIMLVQMLFGHEFIIMVERLDVHLFIWKQKGRCVDLLPYEQMYSQSFHHNNELIPEQHLNEHKPMFDLFHSNTTRHNAPDA